MLRIGINIMMVVPLSNFAIDVPAVIVSVLEPGRIGERLMEMGLVAGTAIRIIRRGMFGDPLQLLVRGSMLSLRGAQARRIQVRALG